MTTGNRIWNGARRKMMRREWMAMDQRWRHCCAPIARTVGRVVAGQTVAGQTVAGQMIARQMVGFEIALGALALGAALPACSDDPRIPDGNHYSESVINEPGVVLIDDMEDGTQYILSDDGRVGLW